MHKKVSGFGFRVSDLLLIIPVLLITCRSAEKIINQPLTPEMKVVLQQVAAYNEGNLEKLEFCFHPDAEVNWYPSGNNDMKGIGEIRDRYARTFKKFPELKYEIVNKIMQGDLVVLHGRQTVGNTRPVYFVSIYQVENGLIKKISVYPEPGK